MAHYFFFLSKIGLGSGCLRKLSFQGKMERIRDTGTVLNYLDYEAQLKFIAKI